jgi:hypothetical protein
MLARQVFIGMIVLATLPHSPRYPIQLIGEQTLLRVNQPSDDIAALSVLEKSTASGVPERLVVRIDRSRPDDKTPLWSVNTQVWLLRADGTALTHTGRQLSVMSADGAAPPGVMQRLPGTERMEFWFAPVPSKGLAGVVVSENGRLFVREIKANPAP